MFIKQSALRVPLTFVGNNPTKVKGERAGAPCYLTVSLPSMPASRWPGTEQ